ncbi:hypothetical protein [Bradyrhizobium liaoningense]
MNRPSGVFPVSGFEQLASSWKGIRAAGATLYGLLVYDGGDHHFPSYMNNFGLLALNSHARRRCALFVIVSPSQAYIDYARTKSNLWAQVFDTTALAAPIREIPHVGEEPMFEVDGKQRSLRQLLTPSMNDFLLAEEVESILEYFGCRPTEHPCLMFFNDLNSKDFWFVDLARWRGWRDDALEAGLRDYFGSADFLRMLAER